MSLFSQFLIFLSICYAQSANELPLWYQPDLYKQNGKLVSVQLVLGKPIRIYVLGREEAAIDLKNLSIKVVSASPAPGRLLKTNRHQDYFTLAEPLDLSGSSLLEVTTKLDNQTETLKFTIPNKKP